LSLEVTPQITPDDKIIMDLEVKKDKVGRYSLGFHLLILNASTPKF